MKSETCTDVYDCIVVGFGGVGSAALRDAARRGWNVLGLDRSGPAHDQGSSHGQSRIIRRAYYEHPNYVPLADQAFEMWDELTKRHRTSLEVKELLTPSGLLQIGKPDSELIRGVLASAQQHDLNIETFTPKQISQRIPLFKVPEGHIGIFEPDAGILRVELCVAAMIGQARKLGAEIRSDVVVIRWERQDDGTIIVRTNKADYRCERLVIAGGAWTSGLLPDLDLGLTVLRKQQHWFQLDRVDQKIQNDFPCFLIEQENGDCFYGFPELDYLGMKVCEHSGGTPVDRAEDLDRSLDAGQLERTESFMRQHMEFGKSRLVHHSICMYTMSPDGHFVVDRYPGMENVVFAAGLSGHGFKFAPVLGKQLIDLLDGQGDSRMEFLRMTKSRGFPG